MSAVNPYHLQDPQNWAVDQERLRHSQALYLFGEYSIFVLMWQITDFDKGLVLRCPLCFDAFDKIAETYKQSAQEKCPNCFGTTFEGGYKAIIIRPAIWDFSEEDINDARRGQIVTATSTIQSTSDFFMNGGDYVLRADGTRWAINSSGGTNHLRTGFQLSTNDRDNIGFNYAQASRADEDTVAYLIPPPPEAVTQIIDVQRMRYPVDFSEYEEIKGPLL